MDSIISAISTDHGERVQSVLYHSLDLPGTWRGVLGERRKCRPAHREVPVHVVRTVGRDEQGQGTQPGKRKENKENTTGAMTVV